MQIHTIINSKAVFKRIGFNATATKKTGKQIYKGRCFLEQCKKIGGYQQQHYHQLWQGLSAVLRSRRTFPPASHSKISAAALRGTCSYPTSLRRKELYWAFTTE